MIKVQIGKVKNVLLVVCCVVCLRDDGVASGRLVRRRRAGPPGMRRSYWLQAVGPPRSHWLLPALSPTDGCNTAAPSGGGGERSRRRHHRRQRTFHRGLFTDYEKITGAATAAAAVVQWEV